MITVTDLRKVYNQSGRKVRALDGVSLTVPKGSVHGIIGHSGAGKSTLVRCLAMLDRPTSGRIKIGGVELTKVHSTALRNARRRLGLVFQHANLFDSRTVWRNIAYPLEVHASRRERSLELLEIFIRSILGPFTEHISRPNFRIGRCLLESQGRRDSIRNRALELLDLVGLADAAKAHPAQLSGGQRQRVGIARALATNPAVLLCDEPTSALDPRTTDEILDLLLDLRSQLGLTILVITHEMHVVKRICDSVSLLKAGRIVESGPLTDVIRTLDGSLSQTLLGIPPHDPSVENGGQLIDVLASGSTADRPVVALTSQHFGVTIPIVAGSVEHLAGITFSHLRLRVPEGTDPDAVMGYLRQLGADAKRTPTSELNGAGR